MGGLGGWRGVEEAGGVVRERGGEGVVRPLRVRFGLRVEPVQVIGRRRPFLGVPGVLVVVVPLYQCCARLLCHNACYAQLKKNVDPCNAMLYFKLLLWALLSYNTHIALPMLPCFALYCIMA